MVHLVAVGGLDSMHIEQVHVPPVAVGAFIPAASQSNSFTVGAAAIPLTGADDVGHPRSGCVEKVKVGNEELGIAIAALCALSK